MTAYSQDMMLPSDADNVRLAELIELDSTFWSVRGEEAGTVIANSKGSTLLKGIKLRLGHKFTLRCSERKPELPKAVKGFRTPSIKKGGVKTKRKYRQ